MATSSTSSGSRADLSRRVESLRLPQQVVHRGSSGWFGWLLSMVIVGAAVFLVTWNFVPARQGGAVSVVTTTATGGPPSAAPAVNSKQEGAPATTARPPANPQSPAPAVVAQAAQGEFALESKGYIVPAHQILVTPQVNGRLLKLTIEEGMRVERNQVVAEVENTEYAAEHRRVSALLESAKQRLLELERGNRPEEILQAEAELAEITAQLPQLEADYARNKELRSNGSVAALDFEKSEAAYQAMLKRSDRLTLALKLMKDGPRQERIAAARAETEQLDAELVKAKWKLDNCTVRAPISGTILRKNAEEGNIVNPVAFNGSYSICEMADLADLEVDLNIQERDVSRVFVGQECQVRSEAYPERIYVGVVSRLMPIADRAKGAVPVRVKLTVPAEEEGVYLKPEMSAIVAFLSRKPTAPTVKPADPFDVGPQAERTTQNKTPQ